MTNQPRRLSGLAHLYKTACGLTTPLRSASNSQSPPYSRWFVAGPSPRSKLDPAYCPRKTVWLYRFEYSSKNEPQRYDWAHALQGREPRQLLQPRVVPQQDV